MTASKDWAEKQITWTPLSGIWIENFFPYRLNIECRRLRHTEDIFFPIKTEMLRDEEQFGVYRETWIGHVSNPPKSTSETHSWYFSEPQRIKKFVERYEGRYLEEWPGMKLTGWVRGPKDEILDIHTLEEFTMDYPYCVEISAEHDGVDIQDWLLENAMVHVTDWKAIKISHRGVYEVYFRDANKAVMTKLRWSGVGFGS